jgi:hypothetical protein
MTGLPFGKSFPAQVQRHCQTDGPQLPQRFTNDRDDSIEILPIGPRPKVMHGDTAKRSLTPIVSHSYTTV